MSLDVGMFQGGALLLAAALILLWPRPPRPRDELFALFGVCGVSALLGARLFWALVAALRGEPEVLARLVSIEGGFGSLGALAGAALALGLATRGQPRRARRALLDFFAPIGLVALALARLGCARHGCDFGRVALHPERWPHTSRYLTPEAPAWQWFASQGGLLADGGTPPLVPLPVLLSGWTLVVVILGVGLTRRSAPGARAGLLATGYLLGRALLETLRHPAAGASLAGLNVNLLACALGALGALLLWRHQNREDAMT